MRWAVTGVLLVASACGEDVLVGSDEVDPRLPPGATPVALWLQVEGSAVSASGPRQTPSLGVVQIETIELREGADDSMPTVLLDAADGPFELPYVEGQRRAAGWVAGEALAGRSFGSVTVGFRRVEYQVLVQVHGLGPEPTESMVALSFPGRTGAESVDYGLPGLAPSGTFGGVVEEPPEGGAIGSEGSLRSYTLPITFAGPEEVLPGMELTVTLGIQESFRWEDQEMPAYRTDEFDVELPQMDGEVVPEPVRGLGPVEMRVDLQGT